MRPVLHRDQACAISHLHSVCHLYNSLLVTISPSKYNSKALKRHKTMVRQQP
ncbi:hypothetical protein COCNU_06G019800 [Cocos nucifera]|uniref:Uncharacterized protein n=1 Tax=Cocos nucifera TaxID=13894 RepID=A0A8K0IEN9_COCNU|nr:hypothetical protein COCNU_06G019800 [Cocos nucifera]